MSSWCSFRVCRPLLLYGLGVQFLLRGVQVGQPEQFNNCNHFHLIKIMLIFLTVVSNGSRLLHNAQVELTAVQMAWCGSRSYRCNNLLHPVKQGNSRAFCSCRKILWGCLTEVIKVKRSAHGAGAGAGAGCASSVCVVYMFCVQRKVSASPSPSSGPSSVCGALY